MVTFRLLYLIFILGAGSIRPALDRPTLSCEAHAQDALVVRACLPTSGASLGTLQAERRPVTAGDPQSITYRLNNMEVAPAYQRQGVGKALIDHLHTQIAARETPSSGTQSLTSCIVQLMCAGDHYNNRYQGPITFADRFRFYQHNDFTFADLSGYRIDDYYGCTMEQNILLFRDNQGTPHAPVVSCDRTMAVLDRTSLRQHWLDMGHQPQPHELEDTHTCIVRHQHDVYMSQTWQESKDTGQYHLIRATAVPAYQALPVYSQLVAAITSFSQRYLQRW